MTSFEGSQPSLERRLSMLAFAVEWAVILRQAAGLPFIQCTHLRNGNTCLVFSFQNLLSCAYIWPKKCNCKIYQWIFDIWPLTPSGRIEVTDLFIIVVKSPHVDFSLQRMVLLRSQVNCCLNLLQYIWLVL